MVDEVFTFYRLKDEIRPVNGWDKDTLNWVFATVYPEQKVPHIELIKVILEKTLPKDMGISVSFEKTWRDLGWIHGQGELPKKHEMIK